MGGWPFVGRDAELGTLARALRHGPVRAVLVTGAAGVGKTALVRAAARSLARQGWSTRWFVGAETSQERPLGALAELTAHFTGDPVLSMTRGAEELSRLGPRALVVVDDVHRLDDVSASLVARVVRRGAVPLALTARSGEGLPAGLAALLAGGDLVGYALDPLPPETATALARRVLPSAEHHGRAADLARRSGGNPLFLRLLVQDAVHGPPGTADAAGSIGVLPSGLRQVLDQHLLGALGGADTALRSTAELVALGEPVELGVLTSLGCDPADLETLERAGVVVVEEEHRDVRCRTAHPLVGEHLRAGAGVLRTRRVHASLARVLRALPDVDPLRLAQHELASGAQPDPDLLVTAAQLAAQRLDLPLAIRLATETWSVAPRFDAGFVLCYAQSWSEMGAESERTALELREVAGDDHERALVAQVRAGNTYFMLGEPERALGVLTHAADELTDGSAGAEVLAMRSWLRAFGADHPGAVADAERALAAGVAGPLGLAAAVIGLATATGARGRAEVHPLTTGTLARTDGSMVLAMVRFALVEVEVHSLRLSGAIDAITPLLALVASDDGDVHLFGQMGRALRGYAAHARGDVAEAVTTLGDAVAVLRDLDRSGWAYCSLLALSQCHSQQGHPAEALAALRDAEAARHPGFGHREPERLLAHAWCEAALGDVGAALEWCRRAGREAGATGADTYVLAALETALRFGDASVGPALDRLAEDGSLPRARPASVAAHGLAARDAALLLRAADLYTELGDQAASADVTALAADVAARQGRAGMAAGARDTARRIADRHGLSTPALRAVDPRLSRREREVTSMAAAGLSNREIAARLGLSVRTVEGHRYRAALRADRAWRSRVE